MEPIDAVITWVDGDDPLFARKRESYMNGSSLLERDDIAGITRYRSSGEIDWCVCSIMKFAPWIRKIYIVTDGQNPHVERSIRKVCPDSEIPVEVVDHKVIFKGYEQVLPVFNSLSIETVLWRIPGLSDRFIYFNDDMMLWNPVQPSDFFQGDKLVAYGYMHKMFTARFCRFIGGLSRNPRVTFRDTMLNAALLWGENTWGNFLRLGHAPYSMDKRFLEKFFGRNREAFFNNIRLRFRGRDQFNTVELGVLDAMSEGNLIVRDSRKYLLYIEPRTEDNERFVKVLAAWSRNPKALFCCVNSLDRGNSEQKRILTEIISERLLN
ncbi:MAG: hypothetical protein HDS93_00915 [Bacteroidales bacterium]|nr:hypothetical protein [Bacteroidales bacterium]MBD5190408.1 hypothetical protein [Bacteroidales bacterium]MBD5209207.1 hypothetical protein [Bacteroidales bacterium]MDE6083003.1 Stealth CR1 domain-containing protein [Muribaculaceae bacterium]